MSTEKSAIYWLGPELRIYGETDCWVAQPVNGIEMRDKGSIIIDAPSFYM